ncbi:hypothetical protein [Methyloceanibacter sp.]|uniref:hypothetical protein n=1 Tax=Methyloceanibacter sp. TaxID=1965321 RepID=UPI002D24AC20|nr:hypothetical protein [Methyloceanibacter sp.]HZP10371.1 hypothetical protein [Methyloceanibacter sp.]
MTDASPWLVLIALGAFHGLNPAMGWLFAVALGLYRQSRRVVLVSLVPIALGHALAIALVVYAVVFLGMTIDEKAFRIFSGVLLVAWGLFHLLYRHRHRVHIGLRTGLFGLGVWSFVMATGHGAGAMLIPVLMPLERAAMAQGGEHAHHMAATGSLWIATLAVIVHSLAMLITTGIVALIVYQWAGVDFLRRGWINLDLIWSAALIGIGLWLLMT